MERSIHAIDPSVQISEAMQQMAMTNQINSTTDHMLDSMSNEQQQRYYQPQTGQNIHHSATNSVGSMATAPQFMQSHSSSTAGYPAAQMQQQQQQQMHEQYGPPNPAIYQYAQPQHAHIQYHHGHRHQFRMDFMRYRREWKAMNRIISTIQIIFHHHSNNKKLSVFLANCN